MSEAMKLPDLLKALGTDTSFSTNLLSFDTQGEPHKIPVAGVFRLRYFTKDKAGAGMFGGTLAKGVAIVLAVDDDNQANYCLYLYIKHDSSSSGKTVQIAANGISVQASNAGSTVAMQGADSITQYVLQLA